MGNTRSVTRPDGGGIKEFANWDALAHPVPDINLNGRSIKENTYPRQSALRVSLDSGLMGGMSRPEPLEQSVLGALPVVRPDEHQGVVDFYLFLRYLSFCYAYSLRFISNYQTQKKRFYSCPMWLHLWLYPTAQVAPHMRGPNGGGGAGAPDSSSLLIYFSKSLLTFQVKSLFPLNNLGTKSLFPLNSGTLFSPIQMKS